MIRGAGALLCLALLLQGCPSFHKAPTVADLTHHRIRQLTFWQAQIAKPLAERVATAPPELIEYLRMDNEVNGFDGQATPTPLTPEMSAIVKSILAELPPKLKAKVEDKLIGVFVVSGLGSSAYTDFVRDEQNAPVAAFVVLDAEVLKRKANEWLTWKESSPFLADAKWHIEGVLAATDENTEKEAIEFVLIHELAHVVAFDEDVHPLWSIAPKLLDPTAYPFLDLSWTINEGRYIRKIEATTPLPGPIVYYKKSAARPKASELPRYYDWLAKTDFVTLYAATNPFDDFADALATYVHTVLKKKPFELKIYEGKTLRRTFVPCWGDQRCAAKRQVLGDFLN